MTGETRWSYYTEGAYRINALFSLYQQHVRSHDTASEGVHGPQVIGRLKSLQADAETIVGFLSNEASVKQLKQDKTYNLKFLQEVQSPVPTPC